MKKAAIIVAGGSGERIGGHLPKQFVNIKGKPLLFYTLEKFHGITDEIILVLPEIHLTTWEKLYLDFRKDVPIRVVVGGNTRSESVKNGLAEIEGSGVVAIHDAVRPFVSRKLVVRLLEEASLFGNAIPFIQVKESLRYQTQLSGKAVNRLEYVSVQTPQCFDIQIIKNAYRKLSDKTLTDDASLAEQAGETIHLVLGETTNIKITFPEDFIIAEALLSASIV